MRILQKSYNLLNLGIKVKIITSDGDKFSIQAIKKVCLKAPFQSYLVHISRMYRIWITKYPSINLFLNLSK